MRGREEERKGGGEEDRGRGGEEEIWGVFRRGGKDENRRV